MALSNECVPGRCASKTGVGPRCRARWPLGPRARASCGNSHNRVGEHGDAVLHRVSEHRRSRWMGIERACSRDMRAAVRSIFARRHRRAHPAAVAAVVADNGEAVADDRLRSRDRRRLDLVDLGGRHGFLIAARAVSHRHARHARRWPRRRSQAGQTVHRGSRQWEGTVLDPARRRWPRRSSSASRRCGFISTVRRSRGRPPAIAVGVAATPTSAPAFSDSRPDWRSRRAGAWPRDRGRRRHDHRRTRRDRLARIGVRGKREDG